MNTENRKVKRFEIYLYDFGENAGSIQCGRRPVLILQDDRFNENSPTTIVAALTTAIKKEYLPSHIFVGERFGLKKPSMVLLEQIRTVNQNDLLILLQKIAVGLDQAYDNCLYVHSLNKKKTSCEGFYFFSL